MPPRLLLLFLLGLLVTGVAVGWAMKRSARATPIALVSDPLPPIETGFSVYHLGHSLVGRDMPAMLAQLAPDGHTYGSQLGWGASLRQHWDPDIPILGFETENVHPEFRDARDAIGSGDYDAIVLTEMVELRDAIRYHKSPRFLKNWVSLGQGASATTQIYVYETWHQLDDPAGWLNRLDADFETLWVRKLLMPATQNSAQPVRVIPAGQVMAAFVRLLDTKGGIGPLKTREDLFARNDDGSVDSIHLNDLGNYLVALTHFAVLYRESPVGLAHALHRADGTAAQDPGPDAARAMQLTVWDVVRSIPLTGVI